MALGVSMLLSFFFLLSFSTYSSSGTLVGFSYDARRNGANSSPMEIISFLKENKVSPSQIKVFASDHSGLDTLSNSGVPVDLYLNESDVKNFRKSKGLAILWLQKHLLTSLPHVNITSIIVRYSGDNLVPEKQLPLLLASLKSIHSALETFDLNHKIKVSVVFPFTVLLKLERKHENDLVGVVDFIRKCKSFIIVETEVDGELSMGDQFVGSMINSAVSAVIVLHDIGVPMVLNVKSSAVPSAIEVAQFSEKMMTGIEFHEHIRDRIYGVFAEISPMEEYEKKELSREQEQIFHSFRRELYRKPISTIQTTLHDTFIPTPTIVTVPSTNPVTATTTNPANAPITVPSTTPAVTTPTPSYVPVSPSTVPGGNTVTPPTTIPMAPPTNPATTPVPPAGGVPVTTPSPPTGTSPSTGSGQWCVAKTGVPDNVLQTALDYACGIGGADCSAIQSTGSCYNPNTLQNHASYAFDSYYQKHPGPTSCDFKGAAQLVNTNPSTGSCVYPSSTGGGTTTPTTPTPPGGTTPTTPGGTTPPTTPGGTTTPTTPGGITPITPTPPSSAFPGSSGSPDSSTTAPFGFSPPPGLSTSESIRTEQPPLFAVILASCFLTGRLLMDIGIQF